MVSGIPIRSIICGKAKQIAESEQKLRSSARKKRREPALRKVWVARYKLHRGRDSEEGSKKGPDRRHLSPQMRPP